MLDCKSHIAVGEGTEDKAVILRNELPEDARDNSRSDRYIDVPSFTESQTTETKQVASFTHFRAYHATMLTAM